MCTGRFMTFSAQKLLALHISAVYTYSANIIDMFFSAD